MRTATARLLTRLSFLALFIPAVSYGQALERVPAPIDVHVSSDSAITTDKSGPSLMVPEGATVTIAGTTVPLGAKGTTVRVEVKPPSGTVTTLNATIKEDRSWSTKFSSTTQSGKYSVSAFTADGKNSATTTFMVLTGDDIDNLADMIEQELAKQAQEAAAALADAQAALAAKGDFPDHATVAKNLAEVDAALKELPARLKAARVGMTTLGEIAKKYPAGARELEPITTAVQEGVHQAEEASTRVRESGAAAGKTLGVCDRIDAVNEVLSAASLWFDIQGLLFQKIIQLATDKYLPDRIYNAAVPAARRDNTEKFALGENLKAVASAFGSGALGGKVGAAGGLVEFVRKPQNLLLDTAQMLTGLAFDKLCEKFTGPVNGTFNVDATINAGQKFWGYSTAISGRITLMYEKQLAKGNAPIPMTGEIEGNGFFKVYEDLMAFNTFNRQFVLYHALIPPVGTAAAAQAAIDPLGKVARMGTPGYFRVPVKGELRGNELKITVGDAAYNDFTDLVKGRAVYVMIAPAAPIPYTMAANLPIQKAQFILSRGLRTTAVLPVATSSKGKQIVKTAAKSFDRKEVVSNGEVTVTWKIDLKACNPDCQ